LTATRYSFTGPWMKRLGVVALACRLLLSSVTQLGIGTFVKPLSACSITRVVP
jgi:hypothetical protein